MAELRYTVKLSLHVDHETAADCVFLLRTYLQNNPDRRADILDQIAKPLEGASPDGPV